MAAYCQDASEFCADSSIFIPTAEPGRTFDGFSDDPADASVIAPEPPPPPAIEIELIFGGTLLDACEAEPFLSTCPSIGPSLAPLIGTPFSGRIILPAELGPDLDDDPDRGAYEIAPGAGLFVFDAPGAALDFRSDNPIFVVVQDCQCTAACPTSDNYVWIFTEDSATGQWHIVYLWGTDGTAGPESDALPDIDRLRRMAEVKRGYEIYSADYTQWVSTDFRDNIDPAPMTMTIRALVSSRAVPVGSTSAVVVAAFVVWRVRRTSGRSTP